MICAVFISWWGICFLCLLIFDFKICKKKFPALSARVFSTANSSLLISEITHSVVVGRASQIAFSLLSLRLTALLLLLLMMMSLQWWDFASKHSLPPRVRPFLLFYHCLTRILHTTGEKVAVLLNPSHFASFHSVRHRTKPHPYQTHTQSGHKVNRLQEVSPPCEYYITQYYFFTFW